LSTDLHVAVSAQIALQKRMDTTAQNIANINTAGYRAEGMKFEALLAKARGDPARSTIPATASTLPSTVKAGSD
jgi:flagellar basal-body rod protein FlgF